MSANRWRGWLATVLATVAIAASVGVLPPRSQGDTVTLKNGLIYRGTTDKDNTLVSVYDGLKRVYLRDTKIAQIESDASFRNLERFELIQPLEVHGGRMPTYAINVQASDWDELGRRQFSYIGPGSRRPVTMTQAINELGPHRVRYRGVTGYWLGHLATDRVPREVVLGLLQRTDREDQDERLRVARFLIQAEWYAEAQQELDGLAQDFPELGETVARVRASVRDLEAQELLHAIEARRRAGQPKWALSRLRTFPTEGVPDTLLTEVQDQLRALDERAAADRALAGAVRAAAGRLPSETRASWNAALSEILQALAEAPDAVRGRLDAFTTARASESQGDDDPQADFARAVSGWVVGAEEAVADLEQAQRLWTARGLVREYLVSSNESARLEALSQLRSLDLIDPGIESPESERISLEMVTQLALHLPPILRDGGHEPVGGTTVYRVSDDLNPVPTEYAVRLPPEYHPLRRYPAIMALHDGRGPRAAIDWWADEADRRGYIVIAPEYTVPGQAADYRYTASEHAAAILALRDARKRFAIDSDRVFVGGQLAGANMAWDLGLAHPDLFAGAVVISGLPAKYVPAYRSHAEHVPLYLALGDLAVGQAAHDIIFGFVKSLMQRNYDVTFVEYENRGLEDLPEEVGPAFDWMDRYRRDPYPRSFSIVSGRECDDRFFGLVIREFVQGRTTAPEAVEPLGKNLKPASVEWTFSQGGNLVRLRTSGVRRIDVWLTPNDFDFSRRLEVRVNNRTYFKDQPKLDVQPFLEDLRLRGDRQQVYWMRVPVGG